MIYIIAGTRSQAQCYAQMIHITSGQWRYLYEPHDLRGIERGAVVVKVGTWRSRHPHEIAEFHEWMALHGCIVIEANW